MLQVEHGPSVIPLPCALLRLLWPFQSYWSQLFPLPQCQRGPEACLATAGGELAFSYCLAGLSSYLFPFGFQVLACDAGCWLPGGSTLNFSITSAWPSILVLLANFLWPLDIVDASQTDVEGHLNLLLYDVVCMSVERIFTINWDPYLGKMVWV